MESISGNSPKSRRSTKRQMDNHISLTDDFHIKINDITVLTTITSEIRT